MSSSINLKLGARKATAAGKPDASAIEMERRIIWIRWLAILVSLGALPFLASSLNRQSLVTLLALIGLGAIYNLTLLVVLLPHKPQWLTSGYISAIGDVLLVTGGVAEAVVVDLEAVEVDHHHGDRSAGIFGFLELFVEPRVEIPVVGQAGDGVCHRQLLRLVEGVGVAHRNAGALGEGQHQFHLGLTEGLLASQEADDHVGDRAGAVEHRDPEPHPGR